MNILRHLFRRGAFPEHLREAEPVHGEPVTRADTKSPYVLGRPRSRAPGIRLWRNINTLPPGFRFAWGTRCPRRLYRGVHVAPLSGLLFPDDVAADSPQESVPTTWAEAAERLMMKELSHKRLTPPDWRPPTPPDVIWWPVEGGSLKLVRPGSPADHKPECTPNMVANGMTWEDVLRGRCR